MKNLSKIPLTLLICLFVSIFLVVTLCLKSETATGDDGDSLMHYIFSHYAFKYPIIFFDHWAKPVFVLLSAPFASFGFFWLQFFNICCAVTTSLFVFYTAKTLKIKYPYLVFLFLFFSPLYFKLIFSGLTEYLFACILSIGLYFETKNKPIITLTLMSFLPLVRSEGLLIVLVFALYYLVKKKYKLLPLLLIGQTVYTIIGAIYFKNALWVFGEIPYAHLSTPYGHGLLSDLAFRLNYVIEKPIYFLLVVGLVVALYQSIRQHQSVPRDNTRLLIAGIFLVFFVAHSIFWWLGIFKSMGLPRVFIAVMPVVTLLALLGIEKIAAISGAYRYYVMTPFLALTIVYPFTPRAHGVTFNKELFLVPENDLIARRIIPYLRTNAGERLDRLIYYSHPYVSVALGVDYFDLAKHHTLSQLKTSNDVNALVIWDSWYSVIEDGITWEWLSANPRFQLLQTFSDTHQGREIRFAVFLLN